jgi:hypothetical protein
MKVLDVDTSGYEVRKGGVTVTIDALGLDGPAAACNDTDLKVVEGDGESPVSRGMDLNERTLLQERQEEHIQDKAKFISYILFHAFTAHCTSWKQSAIAYLLLILAHAAIGYQA